MSSVYSSGILQNSSRDGAGKPERLFRAAVSAFCSLTRPTRREIAQLDDLALPLVPSVSDDSLRFVAAALSDTPYAPPALVRRLCDAPVEISAPLLARSPILTDIDLIALIGRHGLGHARAISRRSGLDERIARLIRAIGAGRDGLTLGIVADRSLKAVPSAFVETDTPPDRAEETRQRLRSMMRPAGEQPSRPEMIRLRWQDDPGDYRKLRSTALTGVPALFQTALADALGVDFQRARAIAESADVSELIVSLRSLELAEEQAFLVACCVAPARFGHPGGIAAFLEAYAAASPETARAIVRRWKADAIGVVAVAPATASYRETAANRPARQPALKAS